MGQLLGRQIIQSRIWYTEEATKIPDLDYDFAYPITVYDAVKRTMDDNSSSLADEIASIYRLIAEKQPIVEAGVNGRLMTWTGIRGRIGSTEVVRAIATDTINQSNGKIPTERAVGDALATKVPVSTFNRHAENKDIHTTEDEKARWDSMAPMSTFQAHSDNDNIHVTSAQKKAWDGKAEGSDLTGHIYDTANPHNVTAHQVGTYNRQEIDKMFEDLRETFFHYVNIYWDSRKNSASLVDYDETYWNPNFILEYGAPLPEVADPTATYFALIPASDYSTNETKDCLIYVKIPGLDWQAVGVQNMEPGDLVIQYPDTLMYVWVQGRFLPIFRTVESSGGGGDSSSGDSKPGTSTPSGSEQLWKPVMTEDGELTWELSTPDDPPGTMVVRGYTPIKGIDYFDGKDGQGVPLGGRKNELLAKSSDENNDTEWKDLYQVLTDFMEDGGVMPKNIVIWDYIKDRPNAYTSLGDNEDGFVVQKVITEKFDKLEKAIDAVKALIDGLGDVEGIQSDIHAHLNDYKNPHRITPAQIGAVSNATFIEHAHNFDNPHGVTAKQIGLGNVDNTSDLDKPISSQTQAALDDLLAKIKALSTPDSTDDPEMVKYISDIEWVEEENKFIFHFNDGNTLSVILPKSGDVQQVFTQIYYNRETKEIVIADPETGEETRIPLEDMIPVIAGSKGTQIDVTIDDDGKIHATLKADSISGDELIANIHLRGNPTAATQDVEDKSTRLANTEWVRGQVIDNLISYETDRPLSANMGRILNERKANVVDILALIEDLEGIDIIDDLESTSTVAALSANMGRYLDITKAPRVHTSPSGSTFGRASVDVFGHARAAEYVPLMDGTPSEGTDDGIFARGDHRHPTDETRAPMHWPDTIHGQEEFTGTPKTPTPPDDSNGHEIANTEWIRRNAVGVMTGRCHTLGNDPVKIATLESDFMDDPVFLRQTGSTVVIHFDYTDEVESMTMLDVHRSGPAPVLFQSKPVTKNMISTENDHIFNFDGTSWNLLNPAALFELPSDDNSNRPVTAEWINKNMNGVVACTCGTGGQYANKVAVPITAGTTAPPFVLKVGAAVAVTFSEKDESSTAYPTKLNVDGSGARVIIFAGSPLLDGLIGANYTHFFVFDGTYWRLINPADSNSVWDEGGITIGPGGKEDPKPPAPDDPGDDGGDDDDPKVPDNTVVNLMSGYFGYTLKGDGTEDSSGYVDRVWFMISFTPQEYDVEATFSSEAGAFGAKMGNGNTVILSNPKVINISRQTCVVQFSMNTKYPSNSPCHLIYRTKSAWINFKKAGEDG